jgi:hypothetical protein
LAPSTRLRRTARPTGHAWSLGRDHDFFLDPRRRNAVLGRAVRLEGDDHAFLDLDRVVERVEAADDRALVQEEPHAVTELQPEALHLVVEPELLGFWPDAGNLVGGHAGAHELDRGVDPFARLLVGIALGIVGLAHDERPVVASLVANERLDDVEERLVARADQSIAEDVRVRAAPLAGHGIDVVDVLGSDVEQVLRDVGDELALADARLELLGDQLVGAVDHRARGVEQHDLVDGLDFPGVQHDLLRVEDADPLRFERREHGRLDDVDTERHVRSPLGLEDFLELSRRDPEKASIWGDRAAEPDHARMDVLLAQPRAVQAMVLRRRAEVPDVGIAAARQQRVSRHLVARPFPDMGARDIPDVVEVEEQDGPDVRRLQGRAGTPKPVASKALYVPALFPVHVHRTGRSEAGRHRRTLRSDEARMAVGSLALFTHATQVGSRCKP